MDVGVETLELADVVLEMKPDFYLDSLVLPGAVKEETSRGRLRDHLTLLLGKKS